MSGSPRILIKGSTLRILSFFLRVAVAFFLTPFVIHSLGDRLYGLWAVVGAFIGYYGLLDLGLAQAVMRHLSEAIGIKNFDRCNRILNTALIIFAGIGIVVLVVTFAAYVLSPRIAGLFKVRQEHAMLFAQVVLVLGANMAIELPMRAFVGVLFSTLRFDIMSILEIMTLLLRAGLIVLVLNLGYEVLAMGVVTVIAGIPQKFLVFYFAKKNLSDMRLSRKLWDISVVRMLFSYSTYTFIWKISEMLKLRVDVMVIGAFMGLSAVTHFSIGSLLAQHYLAFMAASLGIFLPVFGQLSGKDEIVKVKQVFFMANKISVFVATFVGFGLVSWGKPFIERWMGVAYLDAYPVLLILAVALTFSFWQVPSIELLWTTNAYKLVGILNLVEGLSKLILSLILVRYFGLVGVAFGTLLPMSFIALVLMPFFVSRHLKMQWKIYISKIAKAVLIAVAALIGPTIISKIFSTPDYRVLTMVAVISFLLYSSTLWFFGFSNGEKAKVRNVLYFRRKTTETYS